MQGRWQQTQLSVSSSGGMDAVFSHLGIRSRGGEASSGCRAARRAARSRRRGRPVGHGFAGRRFLCLAVNARSNAAAVLGATGERTSTSVTTQGVTCQTRWSIPPWPPFPRFACLFLSDISSGSEATSLEQFGSRRAEHRSATTTQQETQAHTAEISSDRSFQPWEHLVLNSCSAAGVWGSRFFKAGGGQGAARTGAAHS